MFLGTSSPRGPRLLGLVAGASIACSGGGDGRTTGGASLSTTATTATATASGTTGDTTGTTGATAGGASSSTSSTQASGSTGLPGCAFCDGPNEKCVDDVCVTTCQGQVPDPCGPNQVCDVISGECVDPGATCSLSGDYEPCGASKCGPGSVCDGQGACLPVAPCAEVACLDDGTCWGGACSCQRTHDCTQLPDEQALNGPFSTDIFDMAFAYDCTAFMVTLRSGTDYLRRLTTDGTLTEWPGVANLNMGEVAVLKPLTPPPGIAPGAPPLTSQPAPPVPSNHWGEVAFTYTCCAACGCFVDPPQGVARLDESDPNNPLPLVIPATVTQGSGPFGVKESANAGPMGLTWGQDRVLYVGNSTANGNLDTADLDAATQSQIGTLPARITAGAAVSAVHLLLAVEGGDVYRYNALTNTSEVLVNLGADVTSLEFDGFAGVVYASLQDLAVVTLDPWSGEVEPFETMPALGRVAVSPEGRLYYVPATTLVGNEPILSWDIPDSF